MDDATPPVESVTKEQQPPPPPPAWRGLRAAWCRSAEEAPAAAVLLYFSARPPMDFFVIGIAVAFLGVLFFETPMIALDIRRQITDAEHEKPSKQGLS